MARFRKKPVVVEAITFEELVKHGKLNGGNMVSGMPWSFDYKGYPITHENDNCYLVPTLEGTMRFDRGDMLITGIKGEIYPCKPDIFAMTYDIVDADNPPAPDTSGRLMDEEYAVIALTGEVWKQLDAIPDLHDADADSMETKLAAIQQCILARAGARANPDL